MALSLTEGNVYSPEWTEVGYRDRCPIPKGSRAITPWVCNCRHKADEFSTTTEFQIHTKNKYHLTYVHNFDKTVREDIKLLNLENTTLKRDKAILSGKLEALEARCKREMEKHKELEAHVRLEAVENLRLEARVAELEQERGMDAKARQMYDMLRDTFMRDARQA